MNVPKARQLDRSARNVCGGPEQVVVRDRCGSELSRRKVQRRVSCSGRPCSAKRGEQTRVAVDVDGEIADILPERLSSFDVEAVVDPRIHPREPGLHDKAQRWPGTFSWSPLDAVSRSLRSLALAGRVRHPSLRGRAGPGTHLFAVGRFYGAILGLLAGVSLIASWWPAQRAGRIQPAMVLRGD